MNDHNVAPQSNPVPIQQPKSARRVVFSDSLPKHRRRGFKLCRRLLACCAWGCIGVLGIILAALILTVILTSFLESGLPEIRIKTLDLSDFAIQNSTNPDTALIDARVLMSIEIWNKNEKMELCYSDMEVNLASDDVELGRNVVAGFSQVPGNTTLLNLTMNVEGDPADRESALQLEDDRGKSQMNVQVAMKARIGFHVGIFKLNKVLILVACEFQQKLLVYSVQEPPCNIRMFPVL